jgi:chromosome segregation ATPase
LKIETDKLEASSRLKRNEILEEIEKLKEKVNHQEGKKKQFGIEQETLEREATQEQKKRQELYHEKAEYGRRLKDAKDLIDKLRSQRGNSMKAYGPKMPEVLDAIRRESRWLKRRPVGPFGSTLSLLKPQFGDTLESVLKNSLNAFVVETFEDKNLLFSILERHNMKYIPIFVSEYDLFDYRSGEPDEEYLTVLRVIKFNDEWVKRQLITANKIERTLLMEDRARADEIMSRNPRNIDLCFTSGGYKVGGKSGMKTESIDPYRGVPRFQKDLDGEIRKQQAIVDEMTKKQKELELEIRQMQDKITDLQQRAKDCKRSVNGLDRDIHHLKRQIEEKEDILKEDDPVDLNMYHDDIKECDEKIKSHAQLFQSIKAQQDAHVRELQEIIKKLKVIQSRELARETYSNEFRAKINKLEEVKTKLNSEMQGLNSKKQTIRMRYESKHQAYLESTRMVEQWIEQSREDYPDRVDTERMPHEIEKEIRHLQGIAQDMENEMGISAEELSRQTFEAMRVWSEANEVVKGMEKLSRSLKKMLQNRIEKWEKFRDYIALAAKHYFSYYLHMRGDEGSLRFNHVTKRLDIRVSTGDQYSKGSRQKDSRSLSGGEKSFSQISLLLSLWQSISSPLIW